VPFLASNPAILRDQIETSFVCRIIESKERSRVDQQEDTMTRTPHFNQVCAFGDRLIETGDLDPVYIALVNARLDRDQLAKVLIAYFCFYHLGVAAWLSEQEPFWRAATEAAENLSVSPLGGRWPRGSERRHFRGAKCVAAVRTLSARSPRALIDGLAERKTLSAVVDAVTRWPQFGPWIAFKIADVLERVVGAEIAFPNDTCLMYREPAAALTMLSQQEGTTAQSIYGDLREYFSERLAPPLHDRPCNGQEVETVLCKWKSSTAGHYWVGHDILEVRRALKGWGETAERLIAHMPAQVGWWDATWNTVAGCSPVREVRSW
jgi:hypothetical protein